MVGGKKEKKNTLTIFLGNTFSFFNSFWDCFDNLLMDNFYFYEDAENSACVYLLHILCALCVWWMRGDYELKMRDLKSYFML